MSQVPPPDLRAPLGRKDARASSPRELWRPATTDGGHPIRCPCLPEALEAAGADGFGDPGNDLVEHVVEAGGRLEAEDFAGLCHVRDPLLHVVLERIIRDDR